MPNAALAQQILDQITRSPHTFDMRLWFDVAACGLGLEDMPTLHPGEASCGTMLCVAGWACHLSGWTLICDYLSDCYALKDGQRRSVPDAAQELLGLTDAQARELFYLQSNDVAREAVRQLAEGRPLDIDAAADAAIAVRLAEATASR